MFGDVAKNTDSHRKLRQDVAEDMRFLIEQFADDESVNGRATYKTLVKVFGEQCEVVGVCNGGLEDNYVHKDNGGEDFSLGVMKFANGKSALVEGNYITVGGMDDKVEIYGAEGRITVDLTQGSNVDVYSRPGYSYSIEKADNTVGWTKPAVDEFHNLGYVDELAHAVECVRTGQKPGYGCSGRARSGVCADRPGALRIREEENQRTRGMGMNPREDPERKRLPPAWPPGSGGFRRVSARPSGTRCPSPPPASASR